MVTVHCNRWGNMSLSMHGSSSVKKIHDSQCVHNGSPDTRLQPDKLLCVAGQKLSVQGSCLTK